MSCVTRIALWGILLVGLPRPVFAQALRIPDATWGSRGSAPGQFSSPLGLACDDDGNVYVADAGNGRVQKFSNDGVLIDLFGSSADPRAALEIPQDVAIGPNNEIYVSNFSTTANATIKVFDAGLSFVRDWEIPGPGPLAIDPLHEFVYQSRGQSHGPGTIAQYTLVGSFVREWTYTQLSANPPERPSVGPDGMIFIPAQFYDQIRVYSSAGTRVDEWDAAALPAVIAIDATTAYVGVFGPSIKQFAITGAFQTSWGALGSQLGEFRTISDIAVDRNGSIFVLDSELCRVQKFVGASTPTRKTTWGRLKALYR